MTKYIGDYVNEKGICQFIKEECNKIGESHSNHVYCRDCEVYKKVRIDIGLILNYLRCNPFGGEPAEIY